MKILQIAIVMCLTVFTSCNKDNNDEAIKMLEGHWHVFDFQPDTNSNVDDATLAKQAILKLTAANCDPIEYSFGLNRGVFARDGMRHLTVIEGESETEFSCPSKFDISEGTFDFDNKVLILNYSNGKQQLEATMEGDFLTTKSENISINGKLVSGKLFFVKEIEEH